MKRFIVGLAAAAILSMPMAASALEKMDNSQLRSATGQAGVSIAVDDIVIYQQGLADTTYWDTDGTTMFVGTTPGHMTGTLGAIDKAGVMIDYADNMEKLITIDAILDDSVYGVTEMQAKFGDEFALLDPTGTFAIGIAAAGTSAVAGDPLNGSIEGFTNNISPLSIDVGTCKALSLGLQYNMAALNADGSLNNDAYQVAGVVIGLPTVEITTYSNTDIKDIKIVSDNPLAVNADHSFIQIEKKGATRMAILGGRLEIAPH